MPARLRSDTPEPSDRAQAAHFLCALQQQITQLDADMAKLQEVQAVYQRRSQGFQVARTGYELRQAARQRRHILDMAAALERRFMP